jgi:MFS family permease
VATAQQPRETTPEQLTGPREAFRVATQRNFGPYFLGNALSASGTWFQNLAAALLIYRLTGSAFLLGVLNFAQFIPVLALAPWAGNAADRYDRRQLLLVSQSAAVALSATLGLLAFADLATPAVVIAFALGLGVVSAFAAPAQQALVASLVSSRDLGSAVALNSMTFNIARALGPALAAGAIAAFGIPTAFLINAGSYLVFVVALLLLRTRPQRRERHARLRDSLAMLRAQPRLVWLLLVVMAAGFGSDPVNTLAPAFAEEFGRPDTFAGVIIGVFGAGAVTAALLFAGREGSRRLTAATLAAARLRHDRRLPVADPGRRDPVPVPRRRRLPVVERPRHDAAPARRGGEPARPDHGAVVGRVPRLAPVREPRRRCAGRRVRRTRGRRRPRAAGARDGRPHLAAGSAAGAGHDVVTLDSQVELEALRPPHNTTV